MTSSERSSVGEKGRRGSCQVGPSKVTRDVGKVVLSRGVLEVLFLSIFIDVLFKASNALVDVAENECARNNVAW